MRSDLYLFSLNCIGMRNKLKKETKKNSNFLNPARAYFLVIIPETPSSSKGKPKKKAFWSKFKKRIYIQEVLT